MTEPPTRVLLVEDNPGDARLIEEELAEAAPSAFDLTWVERLKDGLSTLEEDGTDVVLLDLSLPDSTGLDTVQRVHDASPGAPIVVLTGFEDEALGTRAVRGGAQDYLVKDQVDGDRLARAMRYAIERREAQEELESLRRQVAMSEKLASLGALVSGIAQEIRNSTTQITNTIYQLRQRIDETARTHPEFNDLVEDVSEYSATAMDGVSRIDELVRELRQFTKSGAQLEETESLDTIVHEAVDLFRRTHQTKINLHADLQATPTVRVNRTQIQQVVLNLLTNAAEALPDGGSIQVSTGPSGSRAELVIEDHGSGMTQYVQSRMFEPFFTTKEHGAGLGLAIARRIVDTHEGEIGCDTEKGEGTRFTVTLPAADET